MVIVFALLDHQHWNKLAFLACNISHLIPVCSADSYCFEGFCVCNPPLSLFQKQCINLKKNFEEENKKEGIKVKRRRLHLEEFGGNFNRKMFKNEVLRNKVEEKNGKNLSKNLLKNSKNFLKRIFKKSKRRKRKLKEEKEQQQKQNEKKGKIMKEKIMPASFKIFLLTKTLSQRLQGEISWCLVLAHLKISPTFRLIGSKCNANIDHCSAGADCLNSKCVCLEGSVPDTQKRYCRQYPGKSCAKGQMCTDRSECVFGKCKCRRGLELQIFGNISKCGEPKKKNGKMPLAGHLCANNECTAGAKCQNGICTCLEGYNLFHGECLPPRASLSGTNTFHEHSLLFSPNFPLMDSSTFEIKYKERKDDLSEEDPLPTKTVVAGAPCRLSLECPYRTECLRGVCRCKQGETIINGVCRKAIHEVLPGGRCDTQNGVDCIGESHCFYGICVCLYGLVITGQECANSSLMKAVRPGGRCILGQRCTGRSRCVRSICQCPQFVFFNFWGVNAKLMYQLGFARVGFSFLLSQMALHFFTLLLLLGQKADISGDKGCINPSITETNLSKPKKYETKMDDENQEIEEEDDQKLPKFVYTIPAALAAAGERGKYNQILTANQMSINLMDSKTLRSLFAPLLKHSLRRESGEEETRSFGGCKGTNCHPHSFPKFISPPKSSASSILAVGPPSHLDTFNSKNLPESTSSTSPFGIPGTHCSVSTNGQSTSCSGGAICLGGICVCRPGFRPLNGLCQISKVELGERCFINVSYFLN
ncbi:unnamed protein product [Meloidogyne enterolobii]|uniref:Uncharacterized protein n=1 Tax=Meloidogyne enterolobii TaxID=390850 RepID=A0ACB0YEE6_MELEN